MEVSWETCGDKSGTKNDLCGKGCGWVGVYLRIDANSHAVRGRHGSAFLGNSVILSAYILNMLNHRGKKQLFKKQRASRVKPFGENGLLHDQWKGGEMEKSPAQKIFDFCAFVTSAPFWFSKTKTNFTMHLILNVFYFSPRKPSPTRLILIVNFCDQKHSKKITTAVSFCNPEEEG